MAANGPTTYGRVLVVEDDFALRTVISFNLQQAGFEVVAAVDGAEALSRLEQQPVAIIVTDVQMPGMGGMEFCQKLRADARFASVPVMMLTAKGMELDAEQLRADLDIVEVMFKPFSPRQLTRSVARHLQVAAGENA